MDENKKVRKDAVQATNLIEENIRPYIMEHMGELDDDWSEDDLRDIEDMLVNVERELHYLTLVIDEIGYDK